MPGKAQNFSGNERYYLTELVFNPASAGSNEELTAILSRRKTWASREGSPTLTMLNVHVRTSDLYNNPRDFIGSRSSRWSAGLGLYKDQNGLLNTNCIQIPVAYRIKLSSKYTLSFGLAGKFYQSVLSEQDFLATDPGDPHLNNISQQAVFLNFNSGLYLSSSKLRIGLSSTNLAPLSRNARNFYNFEDIRAVYLSCRYKFTLSEDHEFEPYLLLRSDHGGLRADLLLKQSLGKNVGVGFGLASKMGYSFLFSIKVKSYSLGYLLEYSASPLYKYTNGSHMFFLAKSLW